MSDEKDDSMPENETGEQQQGSEPKTVEEYQKAVAGLKADLAKQREARREAEDTIESLRQDPYFKVAEKAYVTGVDAEKFDEALASLVSGTAKEKEQAKADLSEMAETNPEIAKALAAMQRELAETKEQLKQIAPTAAQAAHTATEMKLRTEGAMFCRDYGIAPQSEEAKSIAAAARKIASRTKEDIGYQQLEEVAALMGFKKKSTGDNRQPARTSGGGPTMESGYSAPLGSGEQPQSFMVKDGEKTRPMNMRELKLLASQRAAEQASRGR